VRRGDIGEVPAHLRDSHYARAGSLGHGVGYVYPHDLSEGVAQQQYLPDVLSQARYYLPVERGHETRLAALLEQLRGLLGRH
jgi:putative ATPase